MNPAQLNRAVVIGLALWLLTMTYIALVPTRHYTPDAVNNLEFAETRNIYELWHSQHLLAQWFGYWTYQAAGGMLRAWEAFRAAHALLAGLTVATVYGALRTLTDSDRIAVGGAAALWFSYGFWHYHSDPDIYAAGYAAVALLMWAYIRYLRAPTTRRAVWLALAAALAVLMHQLNVELVGLIGVSLLFSPHPQPLPSALGTGEGVGMKWRRHLVLYAAICLLLPTILYIIGWQSVSAYMQHTYGSAPGLVEWALRYFDLAQSGEATWGVSAAARTIPVAGYTFLLSWALLPPLEQMNLAYALIVGELALGAGLLLAHLPLAFQQFSPLERRVALVCISALLANGVSGWWWQAGNVKFYLFMQINLIVLLALITRALFLPTSLTPQGERVIEPQGVRGTWIPRFALLLMCMALVLSHLVLNLAYETRGGVFDVAALAGDSQVRVRFDDETHQRWLNYISQHKGRRLRDDFCANPTELDEKGTRFWVLREDRAADCPTLDRTVLVARYQADRSRVWWNVYRLK